MILLDLLDLLHKKSYLHSVFEESILSEISVISENSVDDVSISFSI